MTTERTPTILIRDMRALLAKPERWAQGENARLANGDPCDANDRDADCWCLTGALIHVACEREADEYPDGVASEFDIDGSAPDSPFKWGAAYWDAQHIVLATVRSFAEILDDAAYAIVDFNDEEGREHADILLVLDRAMERAEHWGPDSDGYRD